MYLTKTVLRVILVIILIALTSAQDQTREKRGLFKPVGDSLKQYKCPKCFRDEKFGIWDIGATVGAQVGRLVCQKNLLRRRRRL